MFRRSPGRFRFAFLLATVLACLVTASCRSPVAQTLWNAVDDEAEDYDE
ncbi:MAG TPA: hypothetical protein VHB77_15615 [Planctomycetaceae bacterium]|nr:hypothetical protein [Planctomycetaceae bacterium]